MSFAFAHKMFEVVDKNREHILPWLDWAMPEITKTPEDEFKFAVDADRKWKATERFEYTIYDKTTKDFLGGIALIKRGRNINRKFEIGFWLKKDACKKGYMQEAVKCLEKMLFDAGVERLIIRNDVKNLNSVKVAQSLGYKHEGVEKSGRFSIYLNKFADTNVFAKTKSEQA